jgi:ABC-type multidrug transport system fused ATPase/permease subunit
MAWVDIELVLDLISSDQSIPDVENPIPVNINQGCVEFKDVSFSYDKDKEFEE